MRITYLFLALLTFVSLSLSGQDDRKDWSTYPYADGEVLTYIVYYNWGLLWVPAGEVQFTITEKASHVELDVIGRSFSSYDSMFKVRDFYNSKVNKETMLPEDFKRDILEGNYVRFDSIAFDQENQKLVEYFGRTREGAKRYDFAVQEKVHDMVSVIYDLRTHDVKAMKDGDKIPVNIFFDKTPFDLDVMYKGLSSKKIKHIGKVDVHHLQPQLIDGYVFSDGDVMDIWVSDDGNNIPLMIESPITIGSVKAILSGVSGLQHPSTCLPALEK